MQDFSPMYTDPDRRFLRGGSLAKMALKRLVYAIGVALVLTSSMFFLNWNNRRQWGLSYFPFPYTESSIESLQALWTEKGYDDPIYVQYGRFLWNNVVPHLDDDSELS